jgi:hypothetical protein
MRQHLDELAHLPRQLRRIRLELAREPEHPAGDPGSGYIFVAPLDPHDRIDPELWKEQRDHCRVVRFRPGEPQRIGRLVRRPGGSWAFRYSGDDAATEDEAAFHFGEEQLRVGEYLSIREDDEFHVYRIVTVEHV